jgi:RimJ/RimL family protein N-acetyltransferase
MKHYRCLPRLRIERGIYAIEAVQPEQIEAIRQWRNVQLEFLRQTAPISPEQQEDYYASRIWPEMEQSQPANVLVGYFLQDRLIGYGGLVHIAWEHGRAEVSFLADPALAGDEPGYRGHFSNFLALVKEMAFIDLRLRRLFTETYAIRDCHIATLEQSGFRHEGILRGHVWAGGRPVDSIIHGCLETDAG